MKKKNTRFILWVAIILIAFIDAFGVWIGNVIPVLGTILSAVGNTIWEIIEIALVYGLFKLK